MSVRSDRRIHGFVPRPFARLICGVAVLVATHAHATTSLSFWNFLGGGDGVRMKEIVDAYNASQSDYKIVSTTLQWGVPFYTKTRTSTSVGQGPDVITIHLSRVPPWAKEGILRAITSEDLASAGLKADDFQERPWAAAQVDGKAYAIPLDTHPLVLYYNKDLLKQAGLLGDDGQFKAPASMEEFNQMLKTIKEKTGKFGVSYENGPPSPYTLFRLFALFVYQQGGKIIDNGKVAFGDAGKVALQQVADWSKDGYVAKNLDYPTSVANFVTGQAAFMIDGVWEVPTLVDGKKSGTVKFDYGIAPMPKFYSQQVTFGDSHGLAIPNNKGKPISPEKLKGVFQFVAFWEKHESMWAGGGHIPAYKPYADSDEFKNLEPNKEYSDQSAKMVMFDPTGPYGGSGGALQDAAQKAFMPAANGQSSVDEALKRFTADAEKLIQQSTK
jgi:multiple sugar transport system substrate-binding protein